LKALPTTKRKMKTPQISVVSVIAAVLVIREPFKKGSSGLIRHCRFRFILIQFKIHLMKSINKKV